MFVPEIFEKQPWEEFSIWGDFIDNKETGETADLVTSSVVAEDKDGTDVSTTVLDQTTIAVSGTRLEIKVRAGTASVSPYKITFKIGTSLGNKWEVDVMMKIKSL